jgi:tripartite-type tricarboxylate transporter receptor subunit TctC
VSEALRAATSSTEVKDRFRSDGVETVEMSPQQLNEHMAKEALRTAKLMVDLGISKQ